MKNKTILAIFDSSHLIYLNSEVMEEVLEDFSDEGLLTGKLKVEVDHTLKIVYAEPGESLVEYDLDYENLYVEGVV